MAASFSLHTFYRCLCICIPCTSVYIQVLRPYSQNDGLLADFCDGALFKSLPVFQNHPGALQLIAYFEVEVCDPLASRSGVHELGIY